MITASYPYPFDEFLRHHDALRGSGNRTNSFERNVIRVFEYMQRVCPNPDEAQWKMSRFVLIMQYISEHIEDFDKGDFAVNGSPKVGALVGQHLLRAVHEVFTISNLNALGHGPTPESVMELAAKYRPLGSESAEA
jgi:hypothetical protein